MAETLSNIKSLEQGRAKFAYERAKGVADRGGKKAKEYKSYAKKLPMMIKTNGLGASLAFAFSKGKEGSAWKVLYDDVTSWLETDQKKVLLGKHPGTELADAVIELDSAEYRAVTVEVLAFLSWLRRFAEGLIEGDADDM